MAKIYTFTAAIKRDGQEAKNIPNCSTHDGYLCSVSGNTLRPIWDSAALQRGGIAQQSVSGIATIQAAIAAGMSKYLIRFGKQEGYWVWNVEAAKRKKLETAKTVYIYEKKTDPWDDDEPELRMSNKPYPKEVWAAMAPHIRSDRYGYKIMNYRALAGALQKLGWKLNK